MNSSRGKIGQNAVVIESLSSTMMCQASRQIKQRHTQQRTTFLSTASFGSIVRTVSTCLQTSPALDATLTFGRDATASTASGVAATILFVSILRHLHESAYRHIPPTNSQHL